jgi:hypothetical protein
MTITFATWSIQVLLVLEQKRVRSIVDGLEVAPTAPSDVSDAVKEKFRERLILFSERKSVARSTIYLLHGLPAGGEL